MRFSLKIMLVILTLVAAFLALVRISDLASATIFVCFVAWLLSPLWVTFGTLYFRARAVPAPPRRHSRRLRV